jgi:hypothetical protein
VLDEHAGLDAPDVDRPHLDGDAAGGDAHEVPGVCTPMDEAADDAVAGDDEIRDAAADIGDGVEEPRPELSVRLPPITGEGVVVAVILCHEPVRQPRVVSVDHREKGRRKLLSAGLFGHSRLRSAGRRCVRCCRFDHRDVSARRIADAVSARRQVSAPESSARRVGGWVPRSG